VEKATDKHNQNEVDWRERARKRSLDHVEECRMLRNDVAMATQRAKNAEEKLRGRVVEKRGREPSDSRDRENRDGRNKAPTGRDHGGGREGREDQAPKEAEKTPVNVLNNPEPRDADTPTTGSGGGRSSRAQKAKEGGPETPGSTEDLRWPIAARRGGETTRGIEEKDTRERSRDGKQEPMQLTQVPGPPRRELRTEKPWAQDGEQTGGEDESVSTVNTVAPTTGVVDLMNSSCEAGEAAGDLGNGEDDVNYELRRGRGRSAGRGRSDQRRHR
jgi:hypothetical protein